VVAPALAKLDVSLLTAHMFVFYYGCVSTITPPVALASYVAAGIAKADINKVGWTAFFYGLACYLLPFIFFYGPPLLMQGAFVNVAIAAITGLAGVFCIAAFVVGCLQKPLPLVNRISMGVAGLMLLIPGVLSDAAGIIILVVLLQLERRANRDDLQHS
jgi:TRAP-type uncharacterized transport system fused permease subunit